MIRFACPGCQATYTVGDDKAGKTSRCPKCQVPFTVPMQSTLPAPAGPSAAAPKPPAVGPVAAPKPPAVPRPLPTPPKAAPKPPPPPPPEPEQENWEAAAMAEAAEAAADEGNDDFSFGANATLPSKKPTGKAPSSKPPVKGKPTPPTPPVDEGYGDEPVSNAYGSDGDDDDEDDVPARKRPGKAPVVPTKGGGPILIVAGIFHLLAVPAFAFFALELFKLNERLIADTNSPLYKLASSEQRASDEIVVDMSLPFAGVSALIALLAFPAAIGCFIKKKYGKILSVFCGSAGLILGLAVVLVIMQYRPNMSDDDKMSAYMVLGGIALFYFLISALAGFSKRKPLAEPKSKVVIDEDDDVEEAEEVEEMEAPAPKPKVKGRPVAVVEEVEDDEVEEEEPKPKPPSKYKRK